MITIVKLTNSVLTMSNPGTEKDASLGPGKRKACFALCSYGVS